MQIFTKRNALLGWIVYRVARRRLEQKAEATLHVSGADIHADAIDSNMYAAIDALADKLDRSVKKHKERLQDHHAAEARRVARP